MVTTTEVTAAITTITNAKRLIKSQQKELEHFQNLIIRLVTADGITVEKLDNGTHILKAHIITDEELAAEYQLSFHAKEERDGSSTFTIRLKPEP